MKKPIMIFPIRDSGTQKFGTTSIYRRLAGGKKMFTIYMWYFIMFNHLLLH